MKQPKGVTKAHVPHKPVDSRRFPSNVRATATPTREAVRETAHPVTAPRQSQRRVERTKKSPSGT